MTGSHGVWKGMQKCTVLAAISGLTRTGLGLDWSWTGLELDWDWTGAGLGLDWSWTGLKITSEQLTELLILTLALARLHQDYEQLAIIRS